jgi:hypothetical protein
MAYIGNQPAESFTSFATQEFSTSATTSYTLDHAVTNENEIALFVNNVRQQPGSGKAYTATGTALTLSAATASTDTMYCVFLGRALQTVTPATNSVTSAMTNFFNASTSSADLGTGLHVKSGDSSVSSLSVSHDELVVESDGNVGISIIGGTSSTMGVAFGDSGDNDIGRINYVHSDNSMRFINNATENVRVHSNGVMAANAGIALGVGTANTSSNVLDDYEEGTFTPEITDGIGSRTHAIQQGAYTKIGNICYVRIRVELSAGSGNGNHLTVSGLPFTSANTTTDAANGFVFPYAHSSIVNSTSTNLPTLYTQSNITNIKFYKTTGATFNGNDLNSASSANFYIAGVYNTA